MTITPLQENWLELTCTWQCFRREILEHLVTPSYIHDKITWEAIRQRLLLADNPSLNRKIKIVRTCEDYWSVLLSVKFGAETFVTQFAFDLNRSLEAEGLVSREIDERSPLALTVVNLIRTTHSVPKGYATLLSSVGSKTWEHSSYSLQCKINEAIYANLFEQCCQSQNCAFVQRDAYGNYLYNGTPGNLCDYYIYPEGQVGTPVKIELKMLSDTSDENIFKQNLHDGQVCFAVNVRSYEVKTYFIDQALQKSSVSNSIIRLGMSYNKLMLEKKASKIKLFIGIKNLTDDGSIDYYQF